MRCLIIVLALVASCKGNQKSPAPTPQAANTQANSSEAKAAKLRKQVVTMNEKLTELENNIKKAQPLPPEATPESKRTTLTTNRGVNEACNHHNDCEEQLFCSNRGICITEDTRNCQAKSGCIATARCTGRNGICVVASDGDCRKSRLCTELGQCTYLRDACIATSRDDCRSSSICKTHSRCTPKDNECILTDSDCRERPLCNTKGLCAAHNDACVANAPNHCKSATTCKTHGRCTPKDGVCIATSNEDCKQSTRCQEKRMCVLQKNKCVKPKPKKKKLKPGDPGYFALMTSAKRT